MPRDTAHADDDELRDDAGIVLPMGSRVAVDAGAEPDEPTAAERIAALLSPEGGLVEHISRVQVWRVRADNPRKLEYCCDYSTADFEAGQLSMVRQHWGPGTYQINVYGVKPPGTRIGLFGRFVVTLVPAIAGPEAEKTPTQGAPHPDSPIGQLIAQNQRLIEQREREAKEDLPRTLGLVRELMSLLPKPESHGPVAPAPSPVESIKELLGAVVAMKEAAGALGLAPKESAASDDASILGMLAPHLPEFIAALRGGSVPNARVDPAMLQPTDASPALAFPGNAVQANAIMPNVSANAISTSTSIPPQNNPGGSSIPAANGTQTESPNPMDEPLPPLSMEQQVALLRSLVLALVAMASGNVPPEHGASYVVAAFPPEAYDLLDDPNWLDMLVKFVPEAEPHRDWLTKVHALIPPPDDEGDASD